MLNYRSFAQFASSVASWSMTLPEDVDIVVGVPRSGLLAANLLALYRNVPLTDVEGLLCGRTLGSGYRLPGDSSGESFGRRKALVVDDSYDTGRAMREVRAQLESLQESMDVYYGAVYVTDPKTAVDLDYWAEVVRQPRAFEWNILHHGLLMDACLDIDGVLCRDPLPEENDDAQKYREFLLNVRAKWVPSYEVGALVTSRLEKYRPETEKWLAGQGVRYRRLYMLQKYTAEDRALLRPHADFKATVYRRTGAEYFIESDRLQAAAIANLSGKPVFCVESHQMVYPETPRFPAGGTSGHDLLARAKRRLRKSLDNFPARS